MVKITKVYTRTGDAGETGLVGGRRLKKTHPRIEAYGTVDELNSLVGIVRSLNQSKEPTRRGEKFELILEAVQHKLFDLGAELATYPGDEYKGQVTSKAEDTEWLEQVIDTMNEELPKLTSFILPGGSAMNAALHQARTVCRRAERKVLRLDELETVNPNVLTYLNRLSDALFVFGRWSSATLGEKEVLWEPGKAYPDWRWES
jgi:cob(I)alamin adenosyltransferase